MPNRSIFLFGALVWLLSAATPVAFAAPSPNILLQSGFEPLGPLGTDMTAWSTTSIPAGADSGVDSAVAHSGKASYRIGIPADTKLDFFMLGQSLLSVKKGASYAMSAYVRTRGMRDGSGAYISLNFFSGNERIGYKDSTTKLMGDSDWQRVTTTAVVPDGASEVRALLVVNGHGKAWFDDVQVELGDVATDYQPLAADTEPTAGNAAQREAAGWFSALPPLGSRKARIAILNEAFPAGAAAPSQASVLARSLESAGYSAIPITSEQASNSTYLSPSIFDLYIVPTGDAYASEGARALVEYLRRGGALLTTGGYAFDRPLVRFAGRWYDSAELPLGNQPAASVFAAGVQGWKQASNRPGSPRIVAAPGPSGEPGIAISTDRLDIWDTAVSPKIVGTLPAGWSVTRFWAKGDEKTPRMLIEWHETDGSRWKTTVPIGTTWREYTLYAKDFAYWQDSSSVGRGGASDRFHPENATEMQVGVAIDIATKDDPHTVWLAGVRVQADEAGDLRGASPHINTRFAPIRDAMWPDATQLAVFDAGYPLDKVVDTRPSSAQDLISDYEHRGPLRGYAAMTMLCLDGHGFSPNRCRYVPLLSCYDAYGRPRGAAGAMIHHFTGTFAGSSWAIFGVSNTDLFAAGSPALGQVLLPTVAGLLSRFYLHDTEAQYACYRQGEAVHLRTNVSNFGKTPRSATVRFVVCAQGASVPVAILTQAVDAAPGATVPVDVTWAPAQFSSDYYTISAHLETGGKTIDH